MADDSLQEKIRVAYEYENTRSCIAKILFDTDIFSTPSEEFHGNIKVARMYLDSLDKQKSKLSLDT